MAINVGKVWEGTHYCGRSSSYKKSYGKDLSVLGNPFYMRNEVDRDDVCDKYEDYFNEKMAYNKESDFKSAINDLIKESKRSNITLGCFCSPSRCHCDTIKSYILDCNK